MNVLPPAGWYPNPDNPHQQRYWDGTQWTDHLHTPAPVSASETQIIPPSTPDATPTVIVPESAEQTGQYPMQYPSAQQPTMQYAQYPSQQYPAHQYAQMQNTPPAKKSKLPVILPIVIIGVLAIGVGAFFGLRAFLGDGLVPPPINPTAEPTLTDEPETNPTPDPTPTMPAYDEVTIVDGPTDLNALNRNDDYVTVVYSADSFWGDVGSGWETISDDGTWTELTSSTNTCEAIHTRGRISESDITFTNPNDDVSATHEFGWLMFPDAAPIEDYEEFGIWYSGIGQNNPSAITTDLLALDYYDSTTENYGAIFVRVFTQADFAHFTALRCEDPADYDTAYYTFLDFEFSVEPQ